MIDPQAPPDSSPLEPRPYQIEGAQFLWRKQRAMLLDDAGLGKTLQASLASEPPTLILCPTYVVGQWADFLRTQYPGTSVAECTGSREERADQIRSKADWTIANIEMVRTYMFGYYATVIVDESHYFRGHTSRQSWALNELAQRTRRVYMLTASPIMREADDLWMQLHILYPKTFPYYNRFVEKHCKVLQTPWKPRIVGTKDPDALGRLLARYSLRRKYSDVGLYLPQEIPIVLPLNFPKDELARYKKARGSYRLNDIPLDNMGEVLQVLRSLTVCRTKLEALLTLVEDNPTEGIVVFSWHRATAELVSKAIGAALITGDMPADKRRTVAQATQRVSATIASLSEGVDLSNKHIVVFFEEDYTPGRMYQATRRVLRARSTDDTTPVRVYYLHMRHTIDEVIHRAVKRRDSSVRSILREALDQK